MADDVDFLDPATYPRDADPSSATDVPAPVVLTITRLPDGGLNVNFPDNAHDNLEIFGMLSFAQMMFQDIIHQQLMNAAMAEAQRQQLILPSPDASLNREMARIARNGNGLRPIK